MSIRCARSPKRRIKKKKYTHRPRKLKTAEHSFLQYHSQRATELTDTWNVYITATDDQEGEQMKLRNAIEKFKLEWKSFRLCRYRIYLTVLKAAAHSYHVSRIHEFENITSYG